MISMFASVPFNWSIIVGNTITKEKCGYLKYQDGSGLLNVEEFDEKQAKDIFQEAFEIIDKNFPRKSTCFSVSNDKYNLLIKKEKDQVLCSNL